MTALRRSASTPLNGNRAVLNRKSTFPAKSRRRRSMRILLIEDEPRIRAFIASGLGAEGFTVVERDDGQVGLRHALDEQYDLVVLDLGLPAWTG